jgi:undecaprenyl diphosphate synthase
MEELTMEDIGGALDTADIPDPDLIVRTSGEQRLSNFLMWQSAYSEFYFTDVLWPDFDKKELEKAIIYYGSRNRRFGGLENK